MDSPGLSTSLPLEPPLAPGANAGKGEDASNGPFCRSSLIRFWVATDAKTPWFRVV